MSLIPFRRSTSRPRAAQRSRASFFRKGPVVRRKIILAPAPTKHNPYKKEAKEPSTLRRFFVPSVALVLAFAIPGLLFWHPFFSTSHIAIEGTNDIDPKEMRAAIDDYLSFRLGFFFHADNYFLFPMTNVRDMLLEKYPIAHIEIQKSFPDLVTIRLEEKVSRLIYDNGSSYSYIDTSGSVLEHIRSVDTKEWDIRYEMVSSTNEFGEAVMTEQVLSKTHRPSKEALSELAQGVPLVYDSRHKKTDVRDSVLTSATIEGIFAWYAFWEQQESWSDLSYVVIDHELGDARLFLANGMYIECNLLDDRPAQMKRLAYIFDQKNIAAEQYIDVRYGERVFLK